MEIKALPLGYIRVNCYLIKTEKAAIVIDPGYKNEKIDEFLLENKDKERLILLTHAHFDHIGALPALRDKTGVKIAIGEDENELLADGSLNLSDRFHAHIPPFSADVFLKDSEELVIGDIKIKTIFTPGHTKGSVCYLIENVLFSGDTLFYESVGRTDFPTSDFSKLASSVKKLYTLPDETVVFSGHGESTTISHEKKYNPFVNSENL
ncbi:MAG: MBL fold metallo-hydrolase [Clostridia bacterium]|nr:MBL fold metallo-hydrolase [Clostridia bacterium]